MDSLLGPLSTLNTEQWLTMIAGSALLILGKRLYWLAIGGLGAFLAVWLAQQMGQTLEPGLRLAVSGVAGLAGALFAVAAQKMALNLAGSILGALIFGWATYVIHVEMLFKDPAGWPLLAAGVGAFFGLLFAQKLFNATLVVVSSAVGALLLVQGLSATYAWDPGRETVAAGVLFFFGLLVQKGRRKAPRHDE